MAQVKFKSQEEFDAFKKKMADEVSDNNPLATKGPEDQRVKTYTRPDMREGAEPAPSEQLERQELNRKLRSAQMEKEEPKSFSERHPRIAEAGEAIKGAGHTIKEELKRVSKNAEKLDRKEKPSEEESEEEEESKPSKKSKKSKDVEEDFGEDSESMSARSSGKKPFSDDYKEVYSGKKVLSGDYKEVYKGHMGSDEYTSPKVPKTHGNFLQHSEQPQQVRTTAPRQVPQARAPLPMPRVGNFGSSNVKMPTMTFGASGKIPKVAMPSTTAHKIGRGNMVSMNIPTMGGSTLVGKTSNNQMGVPMGSIPKIGNWGKTPLTTELNIPDIGNLTIMGAGKQKGGIKFGLGDVPRFSLGAPQKKKKV